MKIAFFLGDVSGVGGTEKACISIANALASQANEVSIINLWGSGVPAFHVNENIKIHTLFSRKVCFARRYLNVVQRLNEAVKLIGPQVLVDVECMLALFSIPAVFNSGIKHITWEHFNFDVDLGRIERKIARQAAAMFSDVIITLTRRDADLWRKRTIARAKIISIPNAVPATDVRITPFHERERIVLAVGRLTPQKGFDLLLKAWKLVELHRQTWRLIIVGDGDDHAELTSLVTTLNLKSAEIHPATLSISDYFCRAKLFCLSSRFEGFPMVLLEAVSYGLPIVSFDCDFGPAEVVIHGQNGLLVKQGDIDALAQSIIALTEDELKLEVYSHRALMSSSNFSMEKVLKQWLELLK